MNKTFVTFPLALALTASRCFAPTPVPDSCNGAEDCGTSADCEALCAAVERLGCSSRWGVDASDEACLEICRGAVPGLCPRHAARQATCEAVDAATECQR